MLICLPLDGIVIELQTSNDGERIGGSITSDVKFPDPNTENKRLYNHMADAILSMLLAHAVAGIDVASPAYLEGLETALQKTAEESGV